MTLDKSDELVEFYRKRQQSTDYKQQRKNTPLLMVTQSLIFAALSIVLIVASTSSNRLSLADLTTLRSSSSESDSSSEDAAPLRKAFARADYTISSARHPGAQSPKKNGHTGLTGPSRSLSSLSSSLSSSLLLSSLLPAPFKKLCRSFSCLLSKPVFCFGSSSEEMRDSSSDESSSSEEDWFPRVKNPDMMERVQEAEHTLHAAR